MSLQVRWKSWRCLRCQWTPSENLNEHEAEQAVSNHSLAHIETPIKSLFTLTDAEVEALYEYFLKRAGYISNEFDPFIHVLIKRLAQYIEEF